MRTAHVRLHPCARRSRRRCAAYVEGVLADERVGWALPFVTTRTADGRVVGSTRFLDLDDWGPARRVGWPPLGAVDIPRTAEIGATWLAASAQRTAVNTEAKLLMLRHAFDTWDVERITFKTDARNARSRAAIERVGAAVRGHPARALRASDGGIPRHRVLLDRPLRVARGARRASKRVSRALQ